MGKPKGEGGGFQVGTAHGDMADGTRSVACYWDERHTECACYWDERHTECACYYTVDGSGSGPATVPATIRSRGAIEQAAGPCRQVVRRMIQSARRGESCMRASKRRTARG